MFCHSEKIFCPNFSPIIIIEAITFSVQKCKLVRFALRICACMLSQQEWIAIASYLETATLVQQQIWQCGSAYSHLAACQPIIEGLGETARWLVQSIAWRRDL